MSLLFLPAAKVTELLMPKLSASISRVSVEGLKLAILSACFLLNLLGLIICELLPSDGFWALLLVRLNSVVEKIHSRSSI